MRALPTPLFSRRHVLVGLTALPVAASLTTSCSSRSSETDPFYSLLHAAQRDLALAKALPASLRVTHVIDSRKRHIAVLEEEIARQEKMWKKPDSSDKKAFAEARELPSSQTIASLKTALASSATAAEELALSSTGYRAGLAGSISANCRALQKVILA